MKKLSEFEGDAGIEIVADLLPIIEKIAKNPDTMASKRKSVVAFASALLKNNKEEIKGIFALLNETPVEKYKISAASILVDTLTLLNDPEMLKLFGLQSKTRVSSGSASENTEAPVE